MTIDFAAFIDSLKYMGYGLLGIFSIISILIGLVAAIKAIFPAKADKK
nr:hypothetical protein [bacterium]